MGEKAAPKIRRMYEAYLGATPTWPAFCVNHSPSIAIEILQDAVDILGGKGEVPLPSNEISQLGRNSKKGKGPGANLERRLFLR